MSDDFTEDRFDGGAPKGNGPAPGGAAKKAKRTRKSKAQGTHSNGATGAQSAHGGGAAGTQGAHTATPAASGEVPAHLLVVPGLVGEIAKFITDSAQQPQPLWSLGAALMLAGTAAGRHLAGPTLSGTHLYEIALGESGSGKDHPLAVIPVVLKAAGMAEHVGASQFISMPATVNFLQRMPLSACAMDEFGSFLKRINHNRAGEYTTSISGVLRTAWGCSFKPMPTPEWANRRSTVIEAPAMSIFGGSTPDEYFNALEGGDIVNGALNRFILLATDAVPDAREPTIDFHAVPAAIAKGLRDIYRRAKGVLTDAAVAPPCKKLSFAPEAKRIKDAMDAEVQARRRADGKLAPFLARTVENAIRLATIRAIGCGAMSIDAENMIWARDFMLWSSYRMAESAGLYIADTETQAIANAIKRALKGNGKMKRSALVRKLNNKYRVNDFNGVLGMMIESGEIEQEDGVRPPGQTGPLPKFYTLK